MTTGWILLAALAFLALLGFVLGRDKARRLRRAGEGGVSHSLPFHHGLFVAFWSSVPALMLAIVFILSFPSFLSYKVIDSHFPLTTDVEATADRDFLIQKVRDAAADPAHMASLDNENLRAAATEYADWQTKGSWILLADGITLALLGFFMSFRRLARAFPARAHLEKYARCLLMLCATFSVLITASILFSVLFESLRFFRHVPVTEFLFGLEWSPQTAIREGQAGSSGAFGAVPLFLGTILIMLIAMVVAVPIGLMSAITMAEYTSQRWRTIAKPLLEILAGVPTVVYGYFAITTISPAIRMIGESMGLSVASESALGAGLVMGVMIIPFVSSLSDDVIVAVPRSLREASLGLGATRSETIIKVVLPSALPGIIGAILLAMSRAIGETMIVVMAAGLAANLSFNPLDAVTTVTTQIVTLLVGDQEFDSPKTLAAFALGLTLFVVTLLLNIVAIKIVRRYQEKYE